MDADSSATRIDGVTWTASGPDAAREEQQKQFRDALLDAADEEAAATVEQARRDITAVVRRARRDLLLIRAQLHACGLEVPGAPQINPLGEPDDSLDERVPREAIVVGRTQSLRHVVNTASSQLAELSPVSGRVRNDDSTRNAPAPTTRVFRAREIMTASVIVLLAAGGVARWIYSHQQGVGTRPGSPVVVAGAGGAVDRHTPVPPVQIDVPAARSAAPELGAIGVSRVRVQTIRPVWMRIEVDGTDDVGRVYPAGTMREFTPTRDVSIRAGDAGAVLVGVGQAAPAPMGQSGQVLTRKISVGEPRPSIPVAAANVPPTQSLPAAAPPIAAAPVVAEVLPAPGLPDAAREAQPQGPAAAAPPTSDLHAEILAKHQQWLDAYTGGDRQRLRAVTAEGYSLLDERTVAGQNGGAAPEVLDLRIDVAGVGAVLTARLRTLVEGTPNDSLLSEVWVRDNQQRWALMGVRITPVERVTPSGGSSNDLRRTGRGR